MGFDTGTLIALLQIIGINIVLSGDNAVMIALACRSLPPRQQTLGITLGAGVAVLLRMVFTVFITTLISLPFVKLLGGLMLLRIGYGLLLADTVTVRDVRASSHVWGAVGTVVLADAVMSLDNVIAVAAAANGKYLLLFLSLLISIPLVVGGAWLMMVLITRMPIIIALGAALIGYVGGEVIVSDPVLTHWVAAHASWLPIVVPLVGAVLVLDVGWYLQPERFVLSRAPLIVSLLAGLLGYAGVAVAMGDGGGGTGMSLLHMVGPMAGAVIAIGIAELAARMFARPGRGTW